MSGQGGQKPPFVRKGKPPKRSTMVYAIFLAIIVLVQLGCTYFFVSDIVMSVLGLRSEPLSWQIREIQEIGAAVGLVLGLLLGGYALRLAVRRTQAAEQQLRLASGIFMDHLAERFEAWGLTPAERDVALFAIKGMSTQEIAQMRATSEGTVKAQTYAIYRKAGVAGRPQLLSLFIEDLMGEAVPNLKTGQPRHTLAGQDTAMRAVD